MVPKPDFFRILSLSELRTAMMPLAADLIASTHAVADLDDQDRERVMAQRLELHLRALAEAFAAEINRARREGNGHEHS